MSWQTESLGNLLAPAGNTRAEKQNLPVLSITMHDGLVDQSAKFKKRIASQDISSYRVVYTNELVVGFPIDEGVLGFQTKYPAAVVSPAYGIWKLRRPAETYIPFIEGYLRSNEARKIYAKKMRGAVARRRSISREDFLGIEIPFPPLDEQRRIAAVLDLADSLRSQRQESLQLTENLLQSVFIDMFGDPAENRLGFPQCTIGDLLTSANYGTSGKAGSVGNWPVLRMGNITYGGDWDFSSLKYMELEPKDERKYLVNQGEILFNRTNSKELVGKTAVYREQTPMAYAGYLIRCIVNEQADPEYISAFLNSSHGKKVLSSMCKSIVGMANINAKELQSIPILKPPVELQNRFGNTVRSILSLRKVIKETSQNDDSLFSSLQQRAFQGELDLSRLVLSAPDYWPPVHEPERPDSKLAKPKAAALFLRAPKAIQAALGKLDATVRKGEPIQWSADYFKYRILGAQPAPFTFGDVMQKAESVFDESPPYEEIKDMILEMLGQGGGRALLHQRFDLDINTKTKEVSGRKEIVFELAA